MTYQLKILTAALFSVFMLRKTLQLGQWFALVMLFVGVAIVQVQNIDSNQKQSSDVTRKQYPWIGLNAVIVSTICSGFAGTALGFEICCLLS